MKHQVKQHNVTAGLTTSLYVIQQDVDHAGLDVISKLFYKLKIAIFLLYTPITEGSKTIAKKDSQHTW
jgi:hypothetical protein